MNFLIVLSCLFLNLNLHALAEKYQIIDLGILDKDSSEVKSINNKGELCGVYTKGSKSYAYVWSKNGDFNDKSFQRPGNVFITNSSVIYGTYQDLIYYNIDMCNMPDEWKIIIFKWENPFSFFTNINTMSTGIGLKTIKLWDANDQGQLLIMDREIINRNFDSKIYIYFNGKRTRIDSCFLNAGIKINNHSQVLGYYFKQSYSANGDLLPIREKKTVIYNPIDGEVTLFNIPGESSGEAINDLGEVAGTLKEKDGTIVGFYGTPNQIVKIPNFSPCALNNCGQILGKVLDGSVNQPSAIWENGKITLMSSLMTLVDNKGNEWERIDVLTDINDAGEIVGQGVYKGKPHSFFLLPLGS